jgi:hypothetical protein
MTKNARAKKDIRARMEATGENYTTASRAPESRLIGGTTGSGTSDSAFDDYLRTSGIVIAKGEGDSPIRWKNFDGNLSIVGDSGKSNAAKSIVLAAIKRGYDAAVLDGRTGVSQYDYLGADVCSRSSKIASWLRDIMMTERVTPLILVIERAGDIEKKIVEHLVRITRTAGLTNVHLVFVTGGGLDPRLHNSCTSQLVFGNAAKSRSTPLTGEHADRDDKDLQPYEAIFESIGKPSAVARFDYVASRAPKVTPPPPMSIDIVCGLNGSGRSTEALSIEKFYREKEGYSATRWVSDPSEFTAPDDVAVFDSRTTPLSEVFDAMLGGVLVVDELLNRHDMELILEAPRASAIHVVVVMNSASIEAVKRRLSLLTDEGVPSRRLARLMSKLIYTVTLVKDQGASRESFYWDDIDAE